MNNGKRITIQDIANECNISSSTVSRVLNNSVLVSDDKREIILEAAERLGYEKRTIRKQGSRAILNIKLFLPETRNPYINLFYDVAEFVKGLYKGFGDVKTNVIVRINHEEAKIFHNKKMGDIDACIFAFTTPRPDSVKEIEDRGIPLLLVNRESSKHDFVAYDTGKAMALLLEKIVAKRQQQTDPRIKVCYLGFTPITYINEERRLGIADACERFGIPFDLTEDVFEFNALQEIPQDLLYTLKKEGYNAIMCFNDVVALYLYNLGMKTGYVFPDDFSLTGHDDSPALELIGQRIDTIRFNVYQLGKESGKILKRRIIGRSAHKTKVKLTNTYVPGETI